MKQHSILVKPASSLCSLAETANACSGEDPFCGYQDFLNHWDGTLQQIAMQERRARWG